MVSAVMPTYTRTNVLFERGEGAYLFDSKGQSYLDFASGIAVTGLGHGHPALTNALVQQSSKLWHTSNLYRIAGQERLAERLVGASFADTVFFTNSGVEAVECGLKLIRKYFDEIDDPFRYRVITFEGSFHGRTLAAISASKQEKHIHGFAPLVDGFDVVPWGDVEAVRRTVLPETAAILVEPVQGEGGIRVAPEGFLKALRSIADQCGLILFFDEVQCGMGRTGSLFAYEREDVVPDVIAIAKALGGGFPIGACLATDSAAIGMTAGTHGSTFGGNPLGVAVANAVLDVMLTDTFLIHVEKMGKVFSNRLVQLAEQYPHIIKDVRGMGLLLGLECIVSNTDFIERLFREYMLAVPAAGNVVRLLPPLIIGEDHIDLAFDKLSDVCAGYTL